MAASDVDDDSTMVAIYPPKGWVDLLGPHTHSSQAGKLHVTLVYLGGKTPEEAQRALEIVQKAVAKHRPFSMKCNGAAIFDNADAVVRVIQPNGIGLTELRAAIYTALDKAKLLDKQNHGFLPHMTLEYHENRKLPEHWERVAQLPFGRWTVSEVRLMRADKEIGRAKLAPTVKESQMTPFQQGYNAFMKVAFGMEDIVGRKSDDVIESRGKGMVGGGIAGGLLGAGSGALKGGRGGALKGLARGAMTGGGLGGLAGTVSEGGVGAAVGEGVGGAGGALAGAVGGGALGHGVDVLAKGRLGAAGKVIGGLSGLLAGGEMGSRAGIRHVVD